MLIKINYQAKIYLALRVEQYMVSDLFVLKIKQLSKKKNLFFPGLYVLVGEGI
jgi:hypothetical protein